ncbi:centromere protein U isoform X2 [Struthio camelus]|uniref:centromere protein U isoform X2 n=1 Tax=Struthio camelus TaxID=8801 RepID=UPI00051E3621|nr:PREDICTED: centromere protein U isoform X2 [Struthio camelus australis]
MSSKKKTKRNSRSKFNDYKVGSHSRRKLLPPEEPDISRILKVAETEELGEPDDSFDHPLHSTAVDAYGEEHSENESLSDLSGLQRKNTEKSKRTHHLKMSEDDIYKFKTGDSEDEPLKENMVSRLSKTTVMKPKLPSALTSRNGASANSELGEKKKMNVQKAQNTTELLEKRKKRPSEKSALVPCVDDSPGSVQVWCPKGLKRFPKDITELDVVLAEFEKIAADYKQRVDSKICRKAIDGFCSGFKDQITDLITEVQELKNTKRKNAKVITDIKKKRQRLLQVREELMGTEPQLKQLQREYAQLQERKSSLRHAAQFLTDLKELQQDCLDYREENPTEKVVYGMSSLPALLVESRRIVAMERHFKNINTRLQEALNVQRAKLPKKH